MTETVSIKYMGVPYEVRKDQPVLTSLLEHDVPLRFSCCSGACQSCLVKRADGKPPAKAQRGLSPTLAEANVFMACLCDPEPVMDNQGFDVYPQRDIGKAALENRTADPSTKYFICGAPPFVTSLRRALFLGGVSNQNIFSDAFLGSKS